MPIRTTQTLSPGQRVMNKNYEVRAMLDKMLRDGLRAASLYGVTTGMITAKVVSPEGDFAADMYMFTDPKDPDALHGISLESASRWPCRNLGNTELCEAQVTYTLPDGSYATARITAGCTAHVDDAKTLQAIARAAVTYDGGESTGYRIISADRLCR